MTFLNLTTTTGKFSYILSDGEVDEINDQYTYNMVNKEGTEILLIMDIKSDTPNIRLLLSNNETSLLLRRMIKHVWFEE